jgi:hypothetical protein
MSLVIAVLCALKESDRMDRKKAGGGRSLDEWMSLYPGLNDHERSNAIWAMRDIACEQPDVTRQCATFLIRAAKDPINAPAALQALGTVLARQRPDDFKVGPHPYERHPEFDDLVNDAVQLAVQYLDFEFEEQRIGACVALRQIRLSTEAATNGLLMRLRSEKSRDVLYQALAAVRWMPTISRAAEKELSTILKNRRRDAHARALAAEALAANLPSIELLQQLHTLAATKSEPTALRARLDALLQQAPPSPGA